MKRSASLFRGRRLSGLRSALLAALLMPILLACGSAAPIAGPSSAEPEAPSAPVTTPVEAAVETVTVQNDRGTVEGTLEVPEAPGPVPLAIIVSGSGMQDRDGNTPGSSGPDIYRLLALGLRDAGIASLRYDDPGAAKSRDALPARNEQITYEMEVDVVLRWVDAMREDPRFGPILLAGHSQGSLSAILVAQQRDVSVVSLAGAGRPIGRVLRDQLEPRLTAAELVKLDEALAKLEKGELAGPLGPPLDSVLHESVQPYMISWMKYDPRREIAKVSGAALVIQGGTDLQVSTEDAELLASGNERAELLIIPDMCHPLKQATSKDARLQSKQYRDPKVPLHEALVPAIETFARGLPAAR